MHLLHYHVDFKPEIEHTWVKCGLLRQHQQLLGKYLFDGSSLFNVERLSQVFIDLLHCLACMLNVITFSSRWSSPRLGIRMEQQW